MQIADILGGFAAALLFTPAPVLLIFKEAGKKIARIALAGNNLADSELILLQKHFALCIIYSDWRKFLLRLSGCKGEIEKAREIATRICQKYREENPATHKNNDQIIEDSRADLKKKLRDAKTKKWKVAAFS